MGAQNMLRPNEKKGSPRLLKSLSLVKRYLYRESRTLPNPTGGDQLLGEASGKSVITRGLTCKSRKSGCQNKKKTRLSRKGRTSQDTGELGTGHAGGVEKLRLAERICKKKVIRTASRRKKRTKRGRNGAGSGQRKKRTKKKKTSSRAQPAESAHSKLTTNRNRQRRKQGTASSGSRRGIEVSVRPFPQPEMNKGDRGPLESSITCFRALDYKALRGMI